MARTVKRDHNKSKDRKMSRMDIRFLNVFDIYKWSKDPNCLFRPFSLPCLLPLTCPLLSLSPPLLLPSSNRSSPPPPLLHISDPGTVCLSLHSVSKRLRPGDGQCSARPLFIDPLTLCLRPTPPSSSSLLSSIRILQPSPPSSPPSSSSSYPITSLLISFCTLLLLPPPPFFSTLRLLLPLSSSSSLLGRCETLSSPLPSLARSCPFLPAPWLHLT